MGDEVAATTFTREDRQRYRDKVKLDLDVFARMLKEARFDPDRRSIGLEIELNLTEETGDPALAKPYPFKALIKQQLADAGIRPQTPAYADVTIAIQKALSPPASIDPKSVLSTLNSQLKAALSSGALI